MKFHNQRSFMGHEISNVNNKPLLHKKGKQWIVVAVSALILAGFGGMVSTTTHADTTNAQPTTTKVAPKPANTSSAKPAAPKVTQPNAKNITAQANQLHKNLLTNAPTTNPVPHNLEDSNIQAQGHWDYGNSSQNSTSAKWTLDKQGNLNISGNINQNSKSETSFFDALHISSDNAKQIKTMTFSNATAPSDSGRLFDDEAGNHFPNLYQIDLHNLNLSNIAHSKNNPDTMNPWAMFGGLKGLKNVIGLSDFPSGFNGKWLFVGDSNLASVNLQNLPKMSSDNSIFDDAKNVQTITLGSNNSIDKGSFLGDDSTLPSNQQKWTNLQGQTVDLTRSGAKLWGGTTWNAGNTPLQITDTIIYISSETGKQIKCHNAYYPGDVGLLKGTYGKYVNSINPNIWSQYSDVNGQFGTGNNMPGNWNVTPGYNDNIQLDGGTHDIVISPNKVTDTVNYSDGNKHIASKQFTGDISSAAGATNTGYDAGAPAGYHAISNTKFTYGTGDATHTVHVAPDEDYLNYYVNDMGQTSDIVANTENSPISINSNKNGVQNNNNSTFTIPTNYSVDLPTGYHIVKGDGNGSKGLIFNHQNGTHEVLIAPNQKTDVVNYMNNDLNIASDVYTGNDMYANGASDTTFNADNNVPAGYHVASDGGNTFEFDGQKHDVTVYPNSLTIKFNNGNLGSYKVSGLTGSTYNVTNILPKHYQLANNNSDVIDLGSLGKDVDYNINIVPSNVNDTINYMNGSNKVSSVKLTGAYTNKIPSSDVSKNIPADYHLSSSLSPMTFNAKDYNVSVEPNTVNVKYMNGNNMISSDAVTFDGNTKDNTISNDFNIPAGYQLTNGEASSLPFNNQTVNVPVKPLQKTDTINYMYNDTKVGSAQVSGEDMYANNSTFDANTKVPAGYHAVDDNNAVYYDGQQHNVSIAPNVDTDTVDYQAKGKTLASQQFSGNDEHATQAGNNSFDITAKNATKIPSGYELVNNDNNFGFDNGTHDVAVQPIPQPAPYIPSMPVSSAASASSASSEPVASASASNTTSQPSNEAQPIRHYSHYRYAKVITPLQLHTNKHFTDKNGVLVIKHQMAFKIMKIVHDHKLTRYEVRYNNKRYFITANPKFTINNYVQKRDFKSRKHMMVRVITPLIEYRRLHFGKKYVVRNVRKGTVLPVKRVINIGRGEMTRFQLTNGRYVTSNKLFVKVIK